MKWLLVLLIFSANLGFSKEETSIVVSHTKRSKSAQYVSHSTKSGLPWPPTFDFHLDTWGDMDVAEADDKREWSNPSDKKAIREYLKSPQRDCEAKLARHIKKHLESQEVRSVVAELQKRDPLEVLGFELVYIEQFLNKEKRNQEKLCNQREVRLLFYAEAKKDNFYRKEMRIMTTSPTAKEIADLVRSATQAPVPPKRVVIGN